MNSHTKQLQKTLIGICVILLFLFTFSITVIAQEITQKNVLALDPTLVKEDTNYTLPDRVIIAPISVNSTEERISSREHYRGLYYFTIQKLGFNDLPFHYVVADDGTIFEGNEGGDERQISIDNEQSSTIIIAYLTDLYANSFSIQGRDSLEELLVSVVNRNSINPNDISMQGLKFERDEETSSVALVSDEIFGTWNVDLNEIVDNVKSQYQPVEKSYGVEIVAANGPSGEVAPGEVVEFNIELSNLNPSGLYGGTDSELILSKADDSPSLFFLNGEWLSQSEVSIMPNGEFLLPLQTATLTFEAQAPLFSGQLSESFKLKTITGTDVSTNEVTLTMTLGESEQDIIEILDTPTGTLNVRSEASSVAPSFTQVSPGQRFFVLEDAGNGYLKIDLGGGEEGWVAGWFTRPI